MSITQQQTPFHLHRLSTVMEPDPDDPHEAWGVLNPASARSPDGELFIYPRVVAEGNYSRIGIARVIFEHGEPVGVERLGIALEPEESYERSERSVGGVEDPRVTFVEPLGRWVMAYTAVSEQGPRIALAVSEDLLQWHRLGVLQYAPTPLGDFNQYDNKDGMLFPDVVTDPYGNSALAILHRPRYLLHRPDGTVSLEVPESVREERESIWIAYMSLEQAQVDIRTLVNVYEPEFVAGPAEPWESLKIGGGTPPILVPGGWLTYYHGVFGTVSLDPTVPKDVRYVAGALLLDRMRPTRVLYRSGTPVLEPEKHDERFGIVPNVVFPTAVDVRDGGRVDVYYGMADSRVGAATTIIPPQWPEHNG